jgi:hypothetical protein
MANSSNVVPLILFFIGTGLCLWRAPQADRWHAILCVLAGVFWGVLPIFDAPMRSSGYALVVASFLIVGLTQPMRRRAGSTLPR